MDAPSDLTLSEFLALADSQTPLFPFPPPPVAMALRVNAGVTRGKIAAYCNCSDRTLERAERGIFENPRFNRERYAKALKACEVWLSESKPGTLGDIFKLWTDLIDIARNNRKVVNVH